MKRRIKLKQWAEMNGYTYRGAYGVFMRGKLPGAVKTPSGSILVEVDESANSQLEKLTLLVCSLCEKLYGKEEGKEKAEEMLRSLA